MIPRVPHNLYIYSIAISPELFSILYVELGSYIYVQCACLEPLKFSDLKGIEWNVFYRLNFNFEATGFDRWEERPFLLSFLVLETENVGSYKCKLSAVHCSAGNITMNLALVLFIVPKLLVQLYYVILQQMNYPYFTAIHLYSKMFLSRK